MTAPDGGDLDPAAATGSAARPDALDPEADSWLIQEARRDPALSADAYEVLIRRHRARIYRIALRMLGNPQDAEDVTQDVAIKVWTALAGFSGHAQFTTWLYRIVVNRCLNHQRRARPTADLTEAEHLSEPGPEHAVIADHLAYAARDAIAGLPPDLRAAFVLHQTEQMTYREIADILAVPEPTARGRVTRARRVLLRQMRDWT